MKTIVLLILLVCGAAICAYWSMRKNRRNLVSFGNYLLSRKREIHTSELNRNKVTHADIENWREKNYK